jgi:hypothetical protein
MGKRPRMPQFITGIGDANVNVNPADTHNNAWVPNDDIFLLGAMPTPPATPPPTRKTITITAMRPFRITTFEPEMNNIPVDPYNTSSYLAFWQLDHCASLFHLGHVDRLPMKLSQIGIRIGIPIFRSRWQDERRLFRGRIFCQLHIVYF